jgi:hypothetical protein
MLCRWPSSSSIKNRLEADTTALLCHASTFARPVVRALDPARDSSSAFAPSRSLSSTGNRRRDLGRHSVTKGRSSSCEPPDDAGCSCVGTGSGLRIFLCEGGCVRYKDGVEHGHAHVELRLGVVHALAHAAFPARRRCLGIRRARERYWWRTRVARRSCEGWCDGAGVVLGVDNGGWVELCVSADEGMHESVSVGVRWRPCSSDQSKRYPPRVCR